MGLVVVVVWRGMTPTTSVASRVESSFKSRHAHDDDDDDDVGVGAALCARGAAPCRASHGDCPHPPQRCTVPCPTPSPNP
eukprot:833327-Rhodomonas_salina.2